MLRSAAEKVSHWFAVQWKRAANGCLAVSRFWSDAEEWFATSATWSEIRSEQ